MAARAELVEVGWGIQPAEGSPAANPTYLLASLWGGLPEPTQRVDAISAGASFGTVQEVRKYAEYWQADLELPAFALSTGTLLKAMLPTENVTGSDPYAHAFTVAATKRWLTMFSRRPGGMYERYDDGRVESVGFAFTSGEPVVLEATLMGKTPQRLGSAYTPATTERMDRTTPWLHYAGSTMLWDEDDDTPTGDISPLAESGRVRIQRGLTAVPLADTGGLLGFRQNPYEVLLELEMVWANYDAYRASYYGGAGGNTPSPTVIYGSVDFLFVAPQAANRTLRLLVPRMAFHVTPPQPGLGVAVLNIAGDAAWPSSGTLVTGTLTNGLATNYG